MIRLTFIKQNLKLLDYNSDKSDTSIKSTKKKIKHRQQWQSKSIIRRSQYERMWMNVDEKDFSDCDDHEMVDT